MTTITAAPVRKDILVTCAPDRAFQVFAARMGRWWLKSHSLAAADQTKVVVEPFAVGAWHEVGNAGERSDWGHVPAWEPPARLVLI